MLFILLLHLSVNLRIYALCINCLCVISHGANQKNVLQRSLG